MESNASQISFFKYLISRSGYERTDKFAEVVANALHISTSGAYKKIKGISKLSFDESIKICKHFNVSLTQYLDRQGMETSTYSFYSDDVVNQLTSYEEWAENYLVHALELDKLKAGPYKAISFSDEIPFVHYIGFPYLLTFKLFVWNRNNWKVPKYGTQYDLTHLTGSKSLLSTLNEIQDHYMSYDSTDIWNRDFLSSTLNQLRYYTKLGAFPNTEDPLNIIADIKKLTKHLRAVATSGAKMRYGRLETHSKLDIYLNYTHANPDVIYIESEKMKMIYTTYLSPNYLRSTDERICHFTDTYIKSAISQSTLISRVGEVNRENGFSVINKIIEEYEGRIRYILKKK